MFFAPLIGAKPSTQLPNGDGMYTVPPSTKKVVTDSLPMAEYLDANYPSLRTLIPRGTEGLTRAFVHAVTKELPKLFPFMVMPTLAILSEASQGYFRTTREGFFQPKLEDVPPKAEDREHEWAKVKETFNTFAS
jgi:glutathione S-transferase